jgi:CDP-glucose 4,6-dehydratase
VEDMVKAEGAPDAAVWRGRSVLVTGHTGFKGGWLTHWLVMMGAEVHGLALDPPTQPSMFDVTSVGPLLATDARGDIADLTVVERAMKTADPEVVIHMAAQPLVRESYADPLGTFRTNVMGTANVLEAARRVPSVRAVVIVTTDKVYRNREWLYPYRETDELGGSDPYSASKAGAELVTASFRRSFFAGSGSAETAIATVRAGNVIGGGDWSVDRLVPDLFRALEGGVPIRVRYPNASRPWQHVLDPLAGYLMVAERLLSGPASDLPSAWNFGPDRSGIVPVLDVIRALGDALGRVILVEVAEGEVPHETQMLSLDSAQARILLGWGPRWPFHEAIDLTARWHEAWRAGEDMGALTRRQIGTHVGITRSP